MKKWPFVLVILAIMVIPGALIITDSEDSSADTSASVTPTNGATAATLTFISQPDSTTSNWELDIWTYRTNSYGASFTTNDMQSLVQEASVGNWQKYNELFVTISHNQSMINDGITIISASSTNTIGVNGPTMNVAGDYTYTNVSSIGQATQWYIQTKQTSGATSSMYSYVTLDVHVMPIPYTLTYNTNGGTFSTAPQTVFNEGTVVTLPTNITKTGYTFLGWQNTQGQYVTQVTMNGNNTVNAIWSANQYTVTFNANGGTVGTPSKTVTYGSQYGDLPIPTYAGYNFKGWYTDPDNGTLVSSANIYSVAGNQTLYAHWTENVTYWSNGNPNGSVSILYHIDNPNVTNDIVTQYPLYRYDPTITDDFNTEINESFVYTGYYINVEINSVRLGANNYDAKAVVTLYDNDNNVLATETKDFGKWGSFIIKVDSVNATVSYTKVMQFRSFTDYQVMESGTILAYGSYGDFGGLVSQSLKMIPVTTEVPRQSVVQTNVFLNTYGVVLRDPSIDISQYFPELPEVRLNFYSFALYGDAMTINGHRMNVSAPNITVYYTSSSAGNIIADGPGSGISAKSLELTNIYITWDGEKCYLTFAQDNFTVDMGTYTDKNVSFEGIWYYATAIYEPYTATEKSYEVDWWGSFDYSVFGIILASLLILGAIILKATIGGRVLDYVIIICAAIIALIIAGGLINA